MADNAEPRPPEPLLDDEALDRLDDFLDSDRVGEDALDLISAHGFLVALAVAPSEQPVEAWLEELFQGEPAYQSEAEREEITGLLKALRDNAVEVLEQGGLPELPFELTLDGLPAEETPIGDWCAGFMEAVFSDEAAWFQDDEEAAATLLLPFMLLSGLFDDEPDMVELAGDTARQEELVAQLPELVLDLYLNYRVPPETPKPKPRPKSPAKAKKPGKGKKR
ncbi:YecA family protein [Vreelandella malpeensis]|uniref:YecA family protein n=1 Tax=Vreelandella malpeensis TaxID=1172368 RepID=A0ABS8DP11_9GAMM|nr:YecA family protein [Halomonas malpeensis]MCB8888037.1 YecA family protein [Halomonas malpeensis]